MAVISDRINGLTANTAVKAPCRVATTANITLSAEQTIDGIAVVDGDRVLVKDQTAASENGIYEASTSTWQRAKDFNGPRDARQGTYVLVNLGSVNADGQFKVGTVDTFTIGTTNLTFTPVAIQGATGATGATGAMGTSDTAVSGNDTGAGVLEEKITVDTDFLATSVLNEGADEDFNIAPTANAKNAMNLFLYQFS